MQFNLLHALFACSHLLSAACHVLLLVRVHFKAKCAGLHLAKVFQMGFADCTQGQLILRHAACTDYCAVCSL